MSKSVVADVFIELEPEKFTLMKAQMRIVLYTKNDGVLPDGRMVRKKLIDQKDGYFAEMWYIPLRINKGDVKL